MNNQQPRRRADGVCWFYKVIYYTVGFTTDISVAIQHRTAPRGGVLNPTANKIFSNTVLAILKAAPGIGGLQLRKALLIVDAVYHSYYGETLTGITYIKHRHGPVPDNKAHAALFDMALFQIDIIDEPVGSKTKNAHYAIAEPDYSLFNAKTVSIINSAAQFVKKKHGGYTF